MRRPRSAARGSAASAGGRCDAPRARDYAIAWQRARASSRGWRPRCGPPGGARGRRDVALVVRRAGSHSPRCDRTTAFSLAAAVVALAALAVRGASPVCGARRDRDLALATGEPGDAAAAAGRHVQRGAALRPPRRGAPARLSASARCSAAMRSTARRSRHTSRYSRAPSPPASRSPAACTWRRGARTSTRCSDRANQREREQQLLTEQAVADERVRIARELHDVVAHGVSLMVVQAQALGALAGAERDAAGSTDRDDRPRGADRDAPHARRAAPAGRRGPGARAGAGRARRAEPRRARARAPASTSRWRSRASRGALPGRRRPVGLPDRAGGADQRVKHARALRTEVRLRYGADALELSVVDDGAGAIGHGGRPATASSACASASRCSAARSRPGRAQRRARLVGPRGAAAVSARRAAPADRRRPAADARRLPRRARGDRRDGGRRRGRRRRAGRRARARRCAPTSS